jgi:hypothetical protein
VLSEFLRSMTVLEAFMLLTLVLAWCGQAYLSPGILLGGDTGSHIARFLEIRRGLETGSLPMWTNYDYLGSSLLGFTGPFTYVVGGALDVLVRDPVTTSKILLFSTHLAAGWLFFALMRRLDFRPLSAFLASVGFGGSFGLLHLFLFRGVFPQQFTVLLLVLVFYAAEGLMRGFPSRARDWLILTLATAALIINHQPHALYVGLYLVLFGAFSLWQGRWHMRGAWLFASAGILGGVIATFAVVPILFESSWVMIVPESGMLQFHLPTLERLSHLFVWRNTRTTYGIDYWAYLGIVMVVLAGVGGWAALTGKLNDERRRLAVALLPCIVLAFFLYNPVVRDIMFLVFFFALYAVMGAEWLAANAPSGKRVMLFVAVLAVLDVASTSIQPAARRDKQFMIDAGLYLEAKAPNERILEATTRRDGSMIMEMGPSSGPISYYSTVQRVAGHHNMAATQVHNYAETVAKLAENDLHTIKQLSPETALLAATLNVSRVVCLDVAAAGCPPQFKGASQEGPLGAAIHIPNASPVLFSRSLSLLPPDKNLDKPMLWGEDFFIPASPQAKGVEAFLRRYLETAKINGGPHMAETIPVRALPERALDSASAEWQPQLISYTVGLERVDLKIHTNGPGYVQVAHPWFPGNQVTINGRSVQPIQGSLSLIVLPLTAGENVIAIYPVVTPIRHASAVVSLVALILALLGAAGIALASRRTGWVPRRGKLAAA